MGYNARVDELIYFPIEESGKSINRINNSMKDNADAINPFVLANARADLRIMELGYKAVGLYLNNEDILLEDLYTPDTIAGILRRKLNFLIGKTSLEDKVSPEYLEKLYVVSMNALTTQQNAIGKIEELVSRNGKLVIEGFSEDEYIEKDISTFDVIYTNNTKEKVASYALQLADRAEDLMSNLYLRQKRIKEFGDTFELPDCSSKNKIEDNFSALTEYLIARSLAFDYRLNDFLTGRLSIEELEDTSNDYAEKVKKSMLKDGELYTVNKSWGDEIHLINDSVDPLDTIIKYVADVVARQNIDKILDAYEKFGREHKDSNSDNHFTL